MPQMSSLKDLFLKELRDIYDAEKQLTRMLPKMAEAANSTELQNAFREHLQQTEGHVERVEQVFRLMGMTAKGVKCEGMAGIIEEGQSVFTERADPAVLDAELIATAQKAEHYEIAAYGTLATYAKQLGHADAKTLLGETLEEEKIADEKLTRIAEGGINIEAAEAAGIESERAERDQRILAADRPRGRARTAGRRSTTARTAGRTTPRGRVPRRSR